MGDINISGNSGPVSVTVNSNSNNVVAVGTPNIMGVFWGLVWVFIIGAALFAAHPGMGLFVVIGCLIVFAIHKADKRGIERRDAAEHEKEKLSARAEVENELFLQGDSRGTHGSYPVPNLDYPPTIIDKFVAKREAAWQERFAGPDDEHPPAGWRPPTAF
jgi:hypothetical protein